MIKPRHLVILFGLALGFSGLFYFLDEVNRSDVYGSSLPKSLIVDVDIYNSDEIAAFVKSGESSKALSTGQTITRDVAAAIANE